MIIYLDHSIVGLLFEIEAGRYSGTRDNLEQAKALSELIKNKHLNFLVSEDCASELELAKKEFKSKKEVISILDRFNFASINHRIRYGDRYRFKGLTFGGRNPEIKDKIVALLKRLIKKLPENKNSIEYDARELSNCFGDMNKVDYFLSIDQKTVLKFKDEIFNEFKIKVISPVGLLEKVK